MTMENYKDEVIKKLRRYKENEIIFTDHARIQASFRRLDLEEIKRNILNPVRLVFAEKQEGKKPGEEKYNCYFAYSNTQAHRYILVFGDKVIVPTVIKINRKWQRQIER